MAINSNVQNQEFELAESAAKETVAPRRRNTGGGVVWLCLLCVILFLGYHYFLGQADSKLTKEIRARLQTWLPDYHVSLD